MLYLLTILLAAAIAYAGACFGIGMVFHDFLG